MAENDQPKRESSPDSRSPIDQLVELLVYAPVGLVYEYEDVLPQLIRRGKSQVQLAKVLGQMASQQGQARSSKQDVSGQDSSKQDSARQGSGVEDVLSDAIGQAAMVLAKGITEFGQLVGLAPTPPAKTPDHSESPEASGGSGSQEVPSDLAETVSGTASTSETESVSEDDTVPERADDEDGPPIPPIAGYESLRAREIVPLLDDLSEVQRDRVRSYELATRGRKTVLGKLDKLDR